MIKSLFDEEENDKKPGKTGKAEPGPLSIISTETEPKEPVAETVAKPESTESKVDSLSSGPVVPFEIDKPIGIPKADAEPAADDSSNHTPAAIESAAKTPLELKVSELEDELAKLRGQETLEKPIQTEPAYAEPKAAKVEPEAASVEPESATVEPESAKEVGESVALTKKELEPDSKNEVHSKDFVPVSKTASIRNSGLAYSAAIALFGSVIFMLIMGWFADLLLGIQPWGTVLGIVLGAVIGFFQFIRLTSQIINPKPTDFEKVSLLNQVGDMENVGTAEPLKTADSIPEKADPVESGTPEAAIDAKDTPISNLPEASQPEPAKDEETSAEATADSSVPETRKLVADAVPDIEQESKDPSESEPLEIHESEPITKV